MLIRSSLVFSRRRTPHTDEIEWLVLGSFGIWRGYLLAMGFYSLGQ